MPYAGPLYVPSRSPDGWCAPYDGDVRMSDSAHDTGYRFHDWRLWLTDDASKAYVRRSHGVEAWPLVKDGLRCR